MSWAWRAVSDVGTPVEELIRILNVRMGKLSAAVATLFTSLGTTGTFANAMATPSVAGAGIWLVSNTAPTNITSFRDGVAGQEILLWATTANTTLVHSASLIMLGGVNVTMTATDSRRFATVDGVVFREVR